MTRTCPTYGRCKHCLFTEANFSFHSDNYNPTNNFCGLSLDKIDHVIPNRTMDIRGYPSSDLISVVRSPLWAPAVVWFYFDGRKTKKRANVHAKLWIGQGKPKKTFCRSQWRINEKLVDNSVPRNTKKIFKICRNDLRAFALRNYSEGYTRNKFKLVKENRKRLFAEEASDGQIKNG